MNSHQITKVVEKADLVGGQEPLLRVREPGGRASETVLCRDAQRTRSQRGTDRWYSCQGRMAYRNSFLETQEGLLQRWQPAARLRKLNP